MTKIANQLLGKIQNEMGQNIVDTKKNLIEWLERPETANVSVVSTKIKDINGALVL